MSVTVAEALDDADRAACVALRTEVFCGEQGVSPAEEMDGRDDEARHLLLRVDGAPAGTLRLRFVDGAAKIERVCVAQPHRGTGLGAALMEAALRLAAETGAAEARLGSQVSVLGFYEALGFTAHGPEFLDAGIPHRAMTRPLP